jgi:hypothetical protein
MNKLKLDLDGLSVETFDTAAEIHEERGTVHGHWSRVGTCDARVGTCQYGATCGPGCPGTRICTI